MPRASQDLTGERLLLKVSEAANIAGLSRALFYQLIMSGEIPSVKIGRARRVPRRGLEAWIDRKVEESLDD